MYGGVNSRELETSPFIQADTSPIQGLVSSLHLKQNCIGLKTLRYCPLLSLIVHLSY